MVEEDLLFNPMKIGFFCPQTIVTSAGNVAGLLKKFGHDRSPSGTYKKKREARLKCAQQKERCKNLRY